MIHTWAGRILVVSVAASAAILLQSRRLTAQELGEQALHQIRAIYAEKAARTPTERKLATPLLLAYRQSHGEAMIQGLGAFPRTAARAGVDEKGMVVVDIKAVVTEDLLRAIPDLGGHVVSAYPSSEAVRARLPIRRIDALAALPDVRFVRQKARFLLNAGSQTSEGDVAHTADDARTISSIDGSGVRVGVLSGWVASLDDRQATADLPPDCADPPGPGPCVTVMPCTTCDPSVFLSDEGTAMLEVIHDLAPGAQLVFATADGGIANFAANIQALRDTYGCDIVVDDITYFAESAFQDGPIAQAVDAVTASGALYFSSAGNGNRLSAGVSGTWEGDFFNSGCLVEITSPLNPMALLSQGPVHSFGSVSYPDCLPTIPSNPLASDAPDAITLQWSDPWGEATSDYDLFLFNADLSGPVDWSNDDQECASGIPESCSPDPYEEVGTGFLGERIVIVKWSGAARALRLHTYGGQLSIATDGATFGHNAAESAVSVAAVDVSTAGGGAFTGGAANPVEVYSSDGPRRMFFNPNGTAITPGNVLFGTNGGRELQKPDLSAADCVTTTTPGFSPYCGTSASAAHAAAIGALLLSTDNNPSGGQAIAAMFATALDVDPGARDKDSGVGIVMASAATTALVSVPSTNFYTLAPCRVFDTRDGGGPTSGAPLTCGVDYKFTMIGGACGVPASATAISVNITVTGATAQGNVRLFGSGAPAPVVSALNYVAGVNRANNSVAPLSTSGELAARCAPRGSTHLIVDVNGYFE